MTREVIQGHAIEVPEGLAGIRMMLGMLQGQITNINEKIDDNQTLNQEEHRKVHIIVDSTAEAMRNVSRDVAEIKPIVKDYELKAAFINDTINLAKEYRLEKAEREGMRKLLGYLIGVLSLLGGGAAFFISEGIKYMATHHV